MRAVITEELWAVLGPLVAESRRHRPGLPPAVPDRVLFEVLLYRARTGVPWRNLPGSSAVGRRVPPPPPVGRLGRAGRPVRPADGRRGDGRGGAGADRRHHGAGAPARGRGGALQKKLGPVASARRQGLGRSRGGLTNKVIVVAADDRTAAAVEVVPGTCNEVARADRRVAAAQARVPVREVVGDRGFNGHPLRDGWRARGCGRSSPTGATDETTAGVLGQKLVQELLAGATLVQPPADPAADSPAPRLAIRTVSDIRAAKVEWLWPGWLPLGMVTILDGDPGRGKSTIALHLAACVTTGRQMPLMPSGSARRSQADVLILAAEDSPERTLQPRLEDGRVRRWTWPASSCVTNWPTGRNSCPS